MLGAIRAESCSRQCVGSVDELGHVGSYSRVVSHVVLSEEGGHGTYGLLSIKDPLPLYSLTSSRNVFVFTLVSTREYSFFHSHSRERSLEPYL